MNALCVGWPGEISTSNNHYPIKALPRPVDELRVRFGSNVYGFSSNDRLFFSLARI